MKKRTTIKFYLIYISLMLMSVGIVRAQSIKIYGNVNDATLSNSLPGVNSSLKELTTGSISYLVGNFSVEIPAIHEELHVLRVGYRTNHPDIIIKMNEFN